MEQEWVPKWPFGEFWDHFDLVKMDGEMVEMLELHQLVDN